MVRKRMGKGAQFRFDGLKRGPVFLVGDFNNWNRKSHPMVQDGDGMWKIRLPLRPGRYSYKFYSRGNWYNDIHADDFHENVWGSVDSEIRIIEVGERLSV